MLSFCAGMASTMAIPPMTKAAIRATLTSSSSEAWPRLITPSRRGRAPPTRRRQRQPGDHREDRREGDRGDQRQQDGAAGRAVPAADVLGQQG